MSGSENTIENVWYKFEDHLQPQSSQWLARLHLQRTRQRPEEYVDSFVSRVRLQAKKCGTRDTREFNDRVIETIISGVKYNIVQRDLLVKPDTLSLDEAIGMCRHYEVDADQLKELKDVQQSHATQPSAVVNTIDAHNQPTHTGSAITVAVRIPAMLPVQHWVQHAQTAAGATTGLWCVDPVPKYPSIINNTSISNHNSSVTKPRVSPQKTYTT